MRIDGAEIRGIFSEEDAKLFVRYQVRCQFVDKVMGGTPAKADLIGGWLRGRMGLTDDHEIAQYVRKTLEEIGVESPADATYEEIVAISNKAAADRHGNVFKRDVAGLYLESRQIKAGIKESVNVLFAGDKWGRTRKGPKNAVSEWVFVEGQRVHLGRFQPDGTWTQQGVVNSPQGGRPTLTLYEYCDQPEITFVIKSLIDPESGKERLTPEQWRNVLSYLQYSGLGALRSQSFGQFQVMEWSRL